MRLASIKRPLRSLVLRCGLATSAVALAAALLASAAAAAWQAPVPITTTTLWQSPLLAFDPAGNAAIAFQDQGQATFIVRRNVGGSFSAPAQVGTPVPPLLPNLRQLVVPAKDAGVLLFDNGDYMSASVQQPGGSFGPPQNITGKTDETNPYATLLPTARGAVVAGIVGPDGEPEASVLPRGGTQFHGQLVQSDGGSNVVGAADGVGGGAFLAWEGNLCLSISYRPLGGSFSRGRNAACLKALPGGNGGLFDQVGLAGHGNG
jgi:hypothetical protein